MCLIDSLGDSDAHQSLRNTDTLLPSGYYKPHFRDEETKAQ